MNSVCLIGRLTKDPDVSTYGKGKNAGTVAHYTLAVDNGTDNADFIRCVSFGKSAEFAENYLSKGMKIGVTGSIITGSYENKNKETIYTTEVRVASHYFCEKKEG